MDNFIIIKLCLYITKQLYIGMPLFFKTLNKSIKWSRKNEKRPRRAFL